MKKYTVQKVIPTVIVRFLSNFKDGIVPPDYDGRFNREIGRMFLWDTTPQDYKHWSDLFYKETKLTEDDLSFMKAILHDVHPDCAIEVRTDWIP